VIGQASEHVGEAGLRVDIVELGGGDQRVDRGSAPAAFVGAGEGPVLAPQGNGPQLAFGGVVRQAKTPILEEAGEGGTLFRLSELFPLEKRIQIEIEGVLVCRLLKSGVVTCLRKV
jgi:hypothetical protein